MELLSSYTLCEVTGFVSVYFLGGPSLHFLPHQMGDQFAYMDRPLITPHDRQHLQQVWKDYEHETRSWANWGIVQVDAEMNPVPMLEQTIQREA